MWKPKSATPAGRRRKAVAKERQRLGLTKRRKFILVAVLLSVGLLVVQSLPTDARFLALVIYFFVSYGLSAWALFQDLNGIEWLTNLTLPSFFPVSVGLFYFLLPQAFVTRVVVIILFAIGMYALLLTANIFGVAAIRTIQLLRAARAVGFLLTVLTAAFLFHLVLSFKLWFWIVFILVYVVSFPLYLQGLWSSLLEEKLSSKVVTYSAILSLITAQFGAAVAFWPIDVAMGSIFLAMLVYVLLGVFQHLLEERLFRKTMQEYLGFGGIVFVIVIIFVYFRWSL